MDLEKTPFCFTEEQIYDNGMKRISAVLPRFRQAEGSSVPNVEGAWRLLCLMVILSIAFPFL